MNLRAFLDQDVLVQFRGPWHMTIADQRGQPTIAMTQARPPPRRGMVQLANEPPEEEPQITPLVVPIAQGRFVERAGEIFFSYVPDPANGRRIDVQFHPDAIFSVAVVRPESQVST